MDSSGEDKRTRYHERRPDNELDFTERHPDAAGEHPRSGDAPKESGRHLTQFSGQPIVVLVDRDTERLLECAAILPPRRRILGQASAYRGHEFGRHIRRESVERGWCHRDLLHDHVTKAAAFEWQAATQHRVTHDAKGVDVAPAVEVALTARLLRRHVVRRTHDGAHFGERCPTRPPFSHPEIGEHGAARFVVQ